MTDAPLHSPETPGDAAPGSRAPTVLCVDDEPYILRSLERLFRARGFRSRTAETGEDGLAELEKGGVDAILADMRMPGMDGAEFLRIASERYPDIPRMLLTGYADLSSTIRAVNDGQIVGYEEKPWNEERLLILVRQAIQQRAQERERRRLVQIIRRQNAELRALNGELEQRVEARTHELAQAEESLRAGYRATIPVFSRLIEMQEGREAGHGRRVADMACQLGEALGMEHDGDLQQLEFAGLLHDVGKIGLPSHLVEPSVVELNRDQRVALRRHAILGQAALTGVEPLQQAALWIRHHHEYFDGRGYPDHLVGRDIPFGARLLTVANEVDNFRSGYLLGNGLGDDEVITLLKRSRNRRYDPEIADLAMELLARGELGSRGADTRLTAREIRPGMVLSDDVLADGGILLLAAGTTLNERLIDRLQRVEEDEGRPLSVRVLREDADGLRGNDHY